MMLHFFRLSLAEYFMLSLHTEEVVYDPKEKDRTFRRINSGRLIGLGPGSDFVGPLVAGLGLKKSHSEKISAVPALPISFPRTLANRVGRVWIDFLPMGYDVEITGPNEWPLSEENKITLDEWSSLIEKDPKLSFSPEHGTHVALWSEKSDYPNPWFDWPDGNIYKEN